MAEWFNAAVLKTVDVRASKGSNPFPSIRASWQARKANASLQYMMHSAIGPLAQ